MVKKNTYEDGDDWRMVQMALFYPHWWAIFVWENGLLLYLSTMKFIYNGERNIW
jgi:hypothetical protein